MASDMSLAMQDLVDPAERDADGHCQPVLGHAQRLQELLEEHLSRMNQRNCYHLVHVLVIVHDLDVLGPRRSPDEADPPLLVDPDAVLP